MTGACDVNNGWNKIIYKIWSPIYDTFFNSGAFLRARKKLFCEIEFSIGEHILFAGVGTGADLSFVNASNLNITAIDLSPDMLDRATEKFEGSTIEFLQMDVQDMAFPDASFDVVVASLILSVVPDADRCLAEIARVLKPNGKIIIFDKFASKKQRLPWLRNMLRPVVKVFGTDIGLRFETLFDRHCETLQIQSNEPIMLKGLYRKIILRKQ